MHIVLIGITAVSVYRYFDSTGYPGVLRNKWTYCLIAPVLLLAICVLIDSATKDLYNNNVPGIFRGTYSNWNFPVRSFKDHNEIIMSEAIDRLETAGNGFLRLFYAFQGLAEIYFFRPRLLGHHLWGRVSQLWRGSGISPFPLPTGFYLFIRGCLLTLGLVTLFTYTMKNFAVLFPIFLTIFYKLLLHLSFVTEPRHTSYLSPFVLMLSAKAIYEGVRYVRRLAEHGGPYSFNLIFHVQRRWKVVSILAIFGIFILINALLEPEPTMYAPGWKYAGAGFGLHQRVALIHVRHHQLKKLIWLEDDPADLTQAKLAYYVHRHGLVRGGNPELIISINDQQVFREPLGKWKNRRYHSFPVPVQAVRQGMNAIVFSLSEDETGYFYLSTTDASSSKLDSFRSNNAGQSWSENITYIKHGNFEGDLMVRLVYR